MNYLNKQWDKLTVSTTGGRLRIDNNLTEHEPYVYIKNVLTELPAAKTIEDIERLLPFNLKPVVTNAA